MLQNAMSIYRSIKNILVLLIILFLGILIGKLYFAEKVDIERVKSVSDTSFVEKKKAIVKPFKKGERLVYKIKSNGLVVGTSEMIFMGDVIKNGQSLYYVKFKTTVPGVTDIEHIYAQKETFLPEFIERDIEKMGKKITLIEKYDQENGVMKVYEQKDSQEPIEVYEKLKPIHNAIILTYLYRTNSDLLRENTKKSITLPKMDFDMLFVGEQRVKTYLGTEKAFYFASNPSKFHFWLSKGKERLPLKIKQPGVMGYAMILESIDSIDVNVKKI